MPFKSLAKTIEDTEMGIKNLRGLSFRDMLIEGFETSIQEDRDGLVPKDDEEPHFTLVP